MPYKTFFLLSFFLGIIKSYGQYIPKDNAKLNYNQIMFEGPFIENANSYTFLVTYDSIKDPQKKHFFIKQKDSTRTINDKFALPT